LIFPGLYEGKARRAKAELHFIATQGNKQDIASLFAICEANLIRIIYLLHYIIQLFPMTGNSGIDLYK